VSSEKRRSFLRVMAATVVSGGTVLSLPRVARSEVTSKEPRKEVTHVETTESVHAKGNWWI